MQNRFHQREPSGTKRKLDECRMIMAQSLDPRDKEVEKNPKLIKESKIEEVKLFRDANPRTIRIKKNLPNDFKQKLIKLLKKYHECFTWTIPDVLRTDPEITCHKLAIDPSIKPIQQKKRRHD